MKRLQPWSLPPTNKQLEAIAKLAKELDYREPTAEKVKTRLAARNIIVGFKEEAKRRQHDQQPSD